MVSIYQSIARDSRDYQYKKQIDKKIKESEAIKKKRALNESTTVNVTPDGNVSVNVDNTPVAPVVPEVVEPEVAEEVTEEVIEEGCSKEDSKDVKECGPKKEADDDKKTITESDYTSWSDFYNEGKDIGLLNEVSLLDELHEKYDGFENVPFDKIKEVLSKIPPLPHYIEFINNMADYFDWDYKLDMELNSEQIKESEEEIGKDVIDTIVAKISVEDEELANKVKEILSKEESTEEPEEEVEEVTEEVIEEEPLEECEISSFKITRIAPKSQVYMLEAQTKDGLRFITGKNFNEETKVLDEAEISEDKAKASDRFRKLMKGE